MESASCFRPLSIEVLDGRATQTHSSRERPDAIEKQQNSQAKGAHSNRSWHKRLCDMKATLTTSYEKRSLKKPKQNKCYFREVSLVTFA